MRQSTWAFALVLTACGGANDGPTNETALCGFPPGTTVSASIDPGCAGCSVNSASNAADNNFNTSAIMVITNGTANNGITLRATAPAGTTFPNGTVGYWWDLTGLASASWCTKMRTYLNNSLQDDLSANSSTCVGGSSNTGGSWGIGTTKQFDAVEVEFTGGATLHVEEICSHM